MKLTDLLRLYLPNVQALSKNDLEKLLSTKIPLISVPGEAPLPQTPEGIQLGMHGDPAVLVVKCQAQLNAELYKAQVSEDQENWAWSESSRNASMEIKDLPRGKLLYLRMMMKNINGPSDWSAPISFQIPTSGVVIPRLVKPRRKRA